jgi:hypothetical protein
MIADSVTTRTQNGVNQVFQNKLSIEPLPSSPGASGNSRVQYCRESLPAPDAYYLSQGMRLKGCGEWRTALCPFHNDHNPSLRINLASGGFICMACGAHGGDVLEFHRKRHDMTFLEAVRALGAWEAT